MNTLPPELLSSVIESAAECSSIYESYEERLQTLSALALVNRTFYHIAQPLLPQQVYLRKWGSEDLEDPKVTDKLKHLTRSGISLKTDSFTFENHPPTYFEATPIDSTPIDSHPKLDEFSNLKVLRLVNCRDISLRTFQSHSHLTRLALVSTYIYHDPSTNSALPNLVELTLENTEIIVPDSYRDGTTPLFLTQTHFPSLRALGLYNFSAFATTNVSRFKPPLHPAFLAQLDCLTVDEETQLQGLPLSVPFLYDVNPASFLFDPPRSLAIRTPRRPTANMEAASTKTHVRIRFPCERIAQDHQVEAALSFVDDLLGKSTVLEEIYLDIYPRGGRRDYVLSWKLGKKIKKLEELAKEKKVEIIWENHEDDWCRSRVSKEFWRRCKEKKDNKREE